MELRILVVLLSCWVLVACQTPTTDQIAFGLANAPIKLDPRFATDAASERINHLLYQQLVDFDQNSQPIPTLARWQQLSPTHYRFELIEPRPSFSHGQQLTATDVKATYDSVLNPATGSPQKAALKLIERIETPDQKTVDFFLTKQDPLFPGYLTLGILPADLLAKQHPFHHDPVGSGSFQLVAWPQDSHLVLQRRQDQQQVAFLTVKDPTVRVLKLLRGELDLVQSDLPPELVRYLKQQPQINVTQVPGANFSYLGFNLEDQATQQLLVRQAIAQAIDREQIIHFLLGGNAVPANALLLPQHWAGGKDLVGWQYDPEAAQQCLRQAGYSAQNPLKLVYKTSSDPFRIRLATIIQHQLKQVGIEVEVRSYDWGTFYGDIKAGRFQLYSLTWVGIKSPDSFRYLFHSSSVPPDGANRGRFHNQQVDQLITQAESLPTDTDRIPLYQQLAQVLLAELPYIPLWYEDQIAAATQRIQGYHPAADGNYDALMQVTLVNKHN